MFVQPQTPTGNFKHVTSLKPVNQILYFFLAVVLSDAFNIHNTINDVKKAKIHLQSQPF